MLRSHADSLCSVIFPSDCLVCDRPLLRLSRAPVCGLCWNQLPAQDGLLCRICGEALVGLPDDQLCRECRFSTPPFARAFAHGVYRETLRSLLHALKYDRVLPLARPLGALLARQVAAIPDLPPEIVLIPVPLFQGKQRQRGFNQAELLVESLRRPLSRLRPDLRAVSAPRTLERRRATESQAGMTPRQRRLNVRGAFSVTRPAAVAGKCVLLVDDIYTTGATARACALALRKAGAERVLVATVARAQMQRDAIASGSGPPMAANVAFWDAVARSPG